MVIKDAKKYNSGGAMQKKNKIKRATSNQPIVIIDEDALPTKAKRGERKHSVEENSDPKKKKKKKMDSKNVACIDNPITIQNNSASESIKEIEKPPKALKKKRKRRIYCEQESSPEIPSQGRSTKSQEACFLIGEKCKRNASDTCGGNSDHNIKRKKKKKHKLACSLILSQAEDHYSKTNPPTMKTMSHEMLLSDRKWTVVQNAVSKGKNRSICSLTSVDHRGTSSRILEKGTANPIHKLQEKNHCKQDHKDMARMLEKRREVAEQKKKKWRKKLTEEKVDFLLTSEGNQGNHPLSTETLWKTKSGGKQEKTDWILNAEGDRRGSKKKKNCAKVANTCPDLLEDNKNVFDWEGKAAIKRARKKAKISKEERDQAACLESHNFQEISGKQHNTKRKARKNKGSKGHEEEPSPKQAKIKKEAKEREDEIQVVAIKKGNCDEISIDKSRRQALQEDIDRESGKTKGIKEEGELDHHFGQWSTATFDNAERKTKFLRLLGGFKKGPELTPKSPTIVMKRNLALARHGEEKLQQTLQAEFEKAMDWKQQQGAGLGFQPVPRKCIYIDKYASKSIKYED